MGGNAAFAPGFRAGYVNRYYNPLGYGVGGNTGHGLYSGAGVNAANTLRTNRYFDRDYGVFGP